MATNGEKRMVMGMVKNCENCIYSGRPSYDYPCDVCETAYGSAPSKWEIMHIEGADLVEVVRCKDCKKQGNDEECPLLSMMQYTDPDDFCSYGERKDNDNRT